MRLRRREAEGEEASEGEDGADGGRDEPVVGDGERRAGESADVADEVRRGGEQTALRGEALRVNGVANSEEEREEVPRFLFEVMDSVWFEFGLCHGSRFGSEVCVLANLRCDQV